MEAILCACMRAVIAVTVAFFALLLAGYFADGQVRCRSPCKRQQMAGSVDGDRQLTTLDDS